MRLGIDYILNPRLVRGLDYYTKTAFEIQYPPLGAQSAVCGGGRYDGLIEECGGAPTPGIGFAIGLERVLLALDKQLLLPTGSGTRSDLGPADRRCSQETGVYFARAGCVQPGIPADMDHGGRSLKSQMKQANRDPGTLMLSLIGEDEVQWKIKSR